MAQVLVNRKEHFSGHQNGRLGQEKRKTKSWPFKRQKE